MAGFKIDPTIPESRALLQWVDDQIKVDARKLETHGISHDESNHLRGRLSVWRQVQQAAVQREAKIDGRPV